MRRVDVIFTIPNKTEELVAGIVLHNGKLVCAEGRQHVVDSILRERISIPDDDFVPGAEIKTVSPIEEPERWMELAGDYGCTLARTITPEYDDDDESYDLETGRFIGNDKEKPLKEKV